MTAARSAKTHNEFDAKTILPTTDDGRKIMLFSKQMIFVQGDPSDAECYFQQGKVKARGSGAGRERSHHRDSERG
jgi:hypothetical protein